MNIVDSLKKWFYSNNSSAASSDARVPLLNANGTPKGSDTMANIASVLGATNLSSTTLIPKLAGNRTGQDANDLIQTGWYYLYGANNQNSPDQYFFMHTINYGTLDIIQYGVGLVSSEMWVRGYTGTWSSWHKLSHDIPDFYKSYNNLGSLASALGGNGLIEKRLVSLQPNESARLGEQCACVLVHADAHYFNGNKMVSADTDGVHTVFDNSTQGGFDSCLRFFGNNDVWIENISTVTLNIKYISFLEG